MSWFRKSSLEPLSVSMCGVKLGDRLLVVGCGDTELVAALAAKAGLTGRACMVCGTAAERESAAAAVEGHGALVESVDAPPGELPFEPDTFDVAVIRGVLPHLDPLARTRAVEEVRRVIRPGGRCLVIDDARRGGLSGLLGREQGNREYEEAGGGAAILTGAGFKGVRTLANRESLVFVEGVKASSPHF